MADVDIPHFDLPFRVVGGSFATVEQGSLDEIANSVEAILLTPLGHFADDPEFGLADMSFVNQPVGGEIAEQVMEQEPRASLLVEEAPDQLDALLDRIRLILKRRGASV